MDWKFTLNIFFNNMKEQEMKKRYQQTFEIRNVSVLLFFLRCSAWLKEASVRDFPEKVAIRSGGSVWFEGGTKNERQEKKNRKKRKIQTESRTWMNNNEHDFCFFHGKFIWQNQVVNQRGRKFGAFLMGSFEMCTLSFVTLFLWWIHEYLWEYLPKVYIL